MELADIQNLTLRYYNEPVLIRLKDGSILSGYLVGRIWGETDFNNEKKKTVIGITLRNIFGDIDVLTSKLEAIEMYSYSY